MPKAAMNEDGVALGAADDVRLSRKFLRMKPEPQPHRMDHPAHGELRRSLLGPDPPHVFRAALPGKLVRHFFRPWFGYFRSNHSRIST